MQIQLGEKSFDLTFNMGFLKMLWKEFGIDPLQIGELTGGAYFQLITAVVYCGIATTAKKTGQDIPSKDEIEASIDELHPTSFTPIFTAFSTWMATPAEVLVNDTKKEGAAEKAATFQVG